MGNVYHVFISHAWQFGDEYDRLAALLNSARDFHCINWSARSDLPRGLELKELSAEALSKITKDRIRNSNCVLVLSGIYRSENESIQIEMDLAQACHTPLIGINPWKSDRIPKEVAATVLEMVGWDIHSITKAIKRYYRRY